MNVQELIDLLKDQDPMQPTEKVCSKCGISKPFSEYHKDKWNKYGIKTICKVCVNKYFAIYRSLNLDKLKESCNRYKKENAERCKETDKRYKKENREHYNNYNKKYAKNNLDKYRVRNRKRRELKKLLGDFSKLPKDYETIVLNQFNHRCFDCGKDKNIVAGKEIAFVIDHHLPLSKGHKLDFGNMVVQCHSCSSSKGNKDPESYYTKEKLEELKKILSEQVLLNPNLESNLTEIG